jgi:hypothetical protein
MSGSFKGATLSALHDDVNVYEIRSMIKPWKDIMGRIFGTSKPEDHRDFTLLHLCTLKNKLEEVSEFDEESYNLIENTFLVERGVTDSLYYWTRGKVYGQETIQIIEKAVQEELDIVSGYGEIEKILLVNKDKDFIRDVVLREPHRSQVFPGGVEDYLHQQEDYIAFTSRYNDITEVKVIENARDYIERLGLEYIENL